MSDPRIGSSIFTRGAVDLGALRPNTAATNQRPAAPQQAAPQQAAPQQAAPPAGGASPPAQGGGGVAVIDVTEATFQSEVVERSLTTPVVLDLWAEWCEPCKQLSPVLEKLAVEGGGSWVLAKIDVDANPRIAQALRVQGIPMVFAVVGGQPIDAFSGVLPETQLRQWIDAVLKAGGVEVEAPEDPRLDAADSAMMAGDLDAAEQAYKKILAETPADAAAEAGLAQVGLMRRIAGVNPQQVLAAAADKPDDVDAQALAADIEVISGQADQAYKRLVDLARRTSGDDRERVRKHLVSLFTVAGPDDPAVASARRALASALF
jgi:putative thioredoxin